MTDEAREDLLTIGPEGPAGSAKWLIGLAVAALLVGVGVVTTHRGGESTRHRAASSSAVTAPRPVPPIPAVPVRRVDDEYLVQVPPGDMRAALASAACRVGCTAHTLTGIELDHAAAGFSGLRPLAGGFVTSRANSAVQESIEGRARPDALVHLLIERTAAPSTRSVLLTDRPGDGYRSLQLTAVRDGWRFSAVLVVRGTAPPVGAAALWAGSAPPPS